MWKWIQVLQGYDCDLVHIPGKHNPANFLSRRSIQDVKNMVRVRAEEEALIRRLQLGEDQSDDAIQERLDKIFGKSRAETVEADDQGEPMMKKALLVARTRVTLSGELREEIRSSLETDKHWAEVWKEVESANATVDVGGCTYRKNSGLLEIKDASKGEGTRWRIVVPNVPELKQQLMREFHDVPYAGHLGYHKTLKNL